MTKVGLDRRHAAIGSLTFSPDSQRIAYVAHFQERGSLLKLPFVLWQSFAAEKFVVVDGREGKHCGRIDSLNFSPDGRRLDYVTSVVAEKVIAGEQEG